MSKQSVKTTIDANIKQNGVQAITGQVLNFVLNQMVNNLAEEANTAEKLLMLNGFVVYNLNAGNTTTTYTLAQAIAAVPSEFRTIARSIIYRSAEGACFAIFQSIAFISGWTDPANWIVFDSTTLNRLTLLEYKVDGMPFVINNIAGTSSRQFVAGDDLHPAVLFPQVSSFNCNIKDIDNHGYWRFYFYFADGTHGFSGITNGEITPSKPIVGFSIALNSNSETDNHLSLEISIGILKKLEDLKKDIDNIDIDELGGVNIFQGLGNVGKAMIVGTDGKLYPTGIPQPTPSPDTNAVIKIETKKLFLKDDIAVLSSMGAGWSGNIQNGFVHTSGVEPLEFNLSTNGVPYLVGIEATNIAEAAYFVSVGDGYLVDTYNGETTQYVGLIGNGGRFKITPTSSYSGNIKISIKEITTEALSTNSVVLDILNVEAGTMEATATSFWSVAIGNDSLKNSVNASRNIAIGVNALRQLVSGTRNICVGTFAGCNLVNGKGNVAIGADANFLNTGGDDNVSIGRASMGATTAKGNRNVFIGVSAGTNSTGDDNVGIGNNAGMRAAGGSVCVGLNSGFNATGLNNTFIGRNSGYTGGNKAGDWNTCVGPSSSFANNVSKSVAIGFQAVAEKTGQNVIGSASSVETKVFGDIVVHGTDGVNRRIVFNSDHSISWEQVN